MPNPVVHFEVHSEIGRRVNISRAPWYTAPTPVEWVGRCRSAQGTQRDDQRIQNQVKEADNADICRPSPHRADVA